MTDIESLQMYTKDLRAWAEGKDTLTLAQLSTLAKKLDETVERVFPSNLVGIGEDHDLIISIQGGRKTGKTLALKLIHQLFKPTGWHLTAIDGTTKERQGQTRKLIDGPDLTFAAVFPFTLATPNHKVLIHTIDG